MGGAAQPFRPTGERPEDFDTYWRRVMAELDALPVAAEVDPLPLRSTDFADGYGVKFTSLGAYRLFAYYSVPHGPGPFPAIYHAPGYASVVQVPPYEERRRHVVLSICARGQRLSDRPYAAAFPGLLTDGLESAEAYVFRGIAADAVRGLDFLLSRPEVDRSRIGVVGNDLGLLAAALRPGAAAVAMANPLFYAARDLIPTTTAYPWEEVNDAARAAADRAPRLFGTLDYFDCRHHASNVRAAVYLPHEKPGGLFTAERLAPLVTALPGGADLNELTGYGYTDRVTQETWLYGKLGTA